MRTCIKIYRNFFTSTKSTTKRREATRHREATSQWTTGFTVHLTIMHSIASNYCVLNAFSNPSVSPAGACSLACQRVCSVSFVIPFWNVDILFVQTIQLQIILFSLTTFRWIRRSFSNFLPVRLSPSVLQTANCPLRSLRNRDLRYPSGVGIFARITPFHLWDNAQNVHFA